MLGLSTLPELLSSSPTPIVTFVSVTPRTFVVVACVPFPVAGRDPAGALGPDPPDVPTAPPARGAPLSPPPPPSTAPGVTDPATAAAGPAVTPPRSPPPPDKAARRGPATDPTSGP